MEPEQFIPTPQAENEAPQAASAPRAENTPQAASAPREASSPRAASAPREASSPRAENTPQAEPAPRAASAAPDAGPEGGAGPEGARPEGAGPEGGADPAGVARHGGVARPAGVARHGGVGRLAELEGQLRTLVQAGADLHGLFADPVATARIDAGEWDVATAYAYWRGRESEPPVLSARGVAAAPAPDFHRMSSEDFAAFCERVERALSGGERIPL